MGCNLKATTTLMMMMIMFTTHRRDHWIYYHCRWTTLKWATLMKSSETNILSKRQRWLAMNVSLQLFNSHCRLVTTTPLTSGQIFIPFSSCIREHYFISANFVCRLGINLACFVLFCFSYDDYLAQNDGITFITFCLGKFISIFAEIQCFEVDALSINEHSTRWSMVSRIDLTGRQVDSENFHI